MRGLELEICPSLWVLFPSSLKLKINPSAATGPSQKVGFKTKHCFSFRSVMPSSAAPAQGPVLFYKGSVFSNFHESDEPFDFRLPLAVRRTGAREVFSLRSAETGIMLCKATLFNDDAAVAKLLEPHKPLQAKRIGRRVRGFDESAWEAAVAEVARAVLRAKFSSTPALKEALLATGDRAIAEASPRDAKWGIGLGARNPAAQDPSKWRGTNLLGKALEEIRREFRRDASSVPAQVSKALTPRESAAGRQEETPTKRRRVEGPTPERHSCVGGWGYVLSAVLDSPAQEGLVAALEPVQLLPAAAGMPSQKPLVYGGRAARAGNAALQNVPAALLAALTEAVRCLESAGHTQIADFVRGAENITVNKYMPRDTYPMHKDPPCYKPCIVALCLGETRDMSFRPKQGRMEVVSLRAGDVYVVEEEGYKSWKHGMTRRVKGACSSVTLRQWLPE
jgi:ribA/ribD-fused uncharacterized protein